MATNTLVRPYGQYTVADVASWFPHARDKQRFLDSQQIGPQSYYVSRVFMIFCNDVMISSSSGCVLRHNEGDFEIDSMTIMFAAEAFSRSTPLLDLNDIIDTMMVPDGDWRENIYVKQLLDRGKPQLQEVGQAKILFSSLMPFASCKKKDLSVLIVGSSAMDGGGLSYDVLANALTLEGRKGTMTMYDKFETQETIFVGDFKMIKHNSYFVQDDVHYDVVIDDSYAPGSANNIRQDVPCDFGSYKSFNLGDEQPHYIGKERRQYLNAVLPTRSISLPGMDNCKSCNLWSRLLSAFRYNTAEYLWHNVIRMGVIPCTPYDGARMAMAVGTFDKILSSTKRFNMSRNTTVPVGSLAISAAINMRSDSASVVRGIIIKSRKKHGVVKAYRTKVSTRGELAQLETSSFNLTPIIPSHVRVAVVSYDPNMYFPLDYELCPVSEADLVVVPNILVLDELAPTYLVLKKVNKEIPNYIEDAVLVSLGVTFVRYKRKLKRSRSLIKHDYTWEQIFDGTLPFTKINDATLMLLYQLHGGNRPLRGVQFSKTRIELMGALEALQQRREKGDLKERCGQSGCICEFVGPKRPWDLTCSKRRSANPVSACGFTPCFCNFFGPKMLHHTSCVDRRKKEKTVCGAIGCKCATLGYNTSFMPCSLRNSGSYET